MAFDEFRLLVIGNEPAGLWLLDALSKIEPAPGEPSRLGWLCLDEAPSPVCFPSALAPAFNISPGATWSAELLLPKQSVTWNQKTADKWFSSLPPGDPAKPRDALTEMMAPTAAQMQAIRSIIAADPDVIGLAQGLWKALGRTQKQMPETVVHQSRFLTAMQWWSPERELPANVEKVSLSCDANPLTAFKSRKSEGLSFHFKDHGEITARRCVLNLDLRSLFSLCGNQPDFLSLLNLEWEPASLRAMYPLRLLVESDAIPSPVSPLTLFYDTDLIPDPMTEIWPITLGPANSLRELTLWANAPGLVSVEAVLDEFRKGMKRVHRLFPFINQKIHQMSVPLGMDSCYSEESRRKAGTLLERQSTELYHHTGFYTETRTPAIQLLLPYLGCNLPYPVGALVLAKKLLSTFMQKRKPATQEVTASP